MWECGLKHVILFLLVYGAVTPHVGVWIETMKARGELEVKRSLPMWECGLKPVPFARLSAGLMSLPMWECGLKLGVRICGVAVHGHSPCGSVD